MAKKTSNGDELLKAVFEGSSNPMVLAGDDRRYTAVNDAAIKFLRYSREDLLKMHIEDLTPPELRDQVPEAWRQFLTLGTVSGAYDLLTGDGMKITVDFNATANVVPGQHLSIFIVPTNHDGPNPAWESAADDGNAPRTDVKLRPRERQVITMLALGRTGEEIAAELGISKETVRVHVRNAMETLGARTRPQAIGIAIRDRLIDF